MERNPEESDRRDFIRETIMRILRNSPPNDDLDRNLRADETVSFGLDGHDYEIYLHRTNAAKLREDLAPYIAVARAIFQDDSFVRREARREEFLGIPVNVMENEPPGQ
jgi:hypothetical protein